MRKCVIKVKELAPMKDNPHALQEVIVEKEATFHQFGSDWHYANDAGEKLSVTTAIIEMQDGTVKSVSPHEIKFIS